MKLSHALLAAGAATALSFAAPAAAQRSSYDLGNVWEVAEISVEDGQFEAYADWLGTEWKKQQDWAKSKGYILDYHVLMNIHRRAGEPDLYLVVVFKDWPSTAQARKMQDEFVAMMKKDEHVLDTESGGRKKMRTYMGSELLSELKLK